MNTHTHQLNQGASPANKADGVPVAAGVTVLARDTGRILMLQRAMGDDDPAAGTWEFPGGCLEDGEMPGQAAQREWSEETGCRFPNGRLAGTWTSSDGVYQGFVYVIESENDIDLTDRGDVLNPDDPDGDHFEALAWWDPAHLADCPALRAELRRDLDKLLALLADAGE
jgi:8-oxo-dGTP pyrophosphatase MutT (NUDIX family)